MANSLSSAVTLDRRTLLYQPHPRVVLNEFNDPLAGHLFFRRDLDRVHVHHRRRDDHRHRGDGDVGEYGQDVRAVVAGNGDGIKDDRIDRAFLDLSGVRPPPYHNRVHMGNAVFLVNCMDDPARAGGVAGNDPDKLPADCILVITGGVEREAGQPRGPLRPARSPSPEFFI